MVSIRRATATDLAEMVTIDRRAEDGESDRIERLASAIEHDDCFVAADDGAVRGFAVARPGHFYGRHFIDLLVVAEDHRRQGLGRMLIRAVVDAATSVDLFTSTNESNAPMRALLESEGWQFSGRLEGLDEGDPELVFHFRR